MEYLQYISYNVKSYKSIQLKLKYILLDKTSHSNLGIILN